MKDQRWVADERGLPVEDIGGSSARISVSGETVSFFYSNSGTRTADAGQAAATMVEAVLAYGPIANSSGDQVGNPLNTSLSFTSTAFTTEIRLSYKDLESLDGLSFANRLTTLNTLVAAQKRAQAGGVVTPMANGDYVVDYRKGIIWGLKASTQTSLTSAAYKALQKAGAMASTPSGTGSIAIAEDTASTAAEIIVKGGRVRRDTAASSAGTDGDWSTANNDSLGHDWSREGYAAGYEDNSNGVAAFAIKPIASATYSWTTFANLGANTTLNVKASPGNVHSCYFYQTNAAARFEQLHNSATTPSASAVPVFSFLVSASGDKTIGNDFFSVMGYYFSTGIAFAHSSAFGIYTAGTAGDGNRFIQYK